MKLDLPVSHLFSNAQKFEDGLLLLTKKHSKKRLITRLYIVHFVYYFKKQYNKRQTLRLLITVQNYLLFEKNIK